MALSVLAATPGAGECVRQAVVMTVLDDSHLFFRLDARHVQPPAAKFLERR
ncbi:hypothetical protein [Amycolatopsis sp. lyj-346]|uniref:hypothetical protein n=1 Tax=Amycolatopsis sp. lyj-346 TaxID=2789289 RepID=UPI00397C3A13